MLKVRYTRFDSEERILRDFLAIDRTTLANERTLLAFIRTALTFVVVGVSAVKFLDSTTLMVIGWVFIMTGIGLGAWGLFRFFETQERIEEAIRHAPEELREAVAKKEKVKEDKSEEETQEESGEIGDQSGQTSTSIGSATATKMIDSGSPGRQ